MAKLFPLSVALVDGHFASPGASASYLNSNTVVSTELTTYTNAAGTKGVVGTKVVVRAYDGTYEKTFVSPTAPSTVTANMNTAYAGKKDNNILPVTIIPISGGSYVKNINIEDIFWLYTNDKYNADSTLMLQNPTRSVIENYRVDEPASTLYDTAVA